MPLFWSLQTAEQWIKDLNSFANNTANSTANQTTGYTKYEPPDSESQTKDAIIAKYKEQVSALKNEVCERMLIDEFEFCIRYIQEILQ